MSQTDRRARTEGVPESETESDYAENGKTRQRDRARLRVARAPRGSTCGRARSRPRTGSATARYVAEIFGAFGMELDTPGTRDTPERYLRALFDATAGYEGEPKLLTAFPAEGNGHRVGDEPDHRGPDRVPEPVRAPRAAVPRLRAHRLHRRRPDHRHLEADAPRAPLRAPLHRAGAPRRADRRRARRAGLAAGRRRAPRGVAPLHADARRRGALAHDHDLLARRLRGPRAAARVPARGPQHTAVTEPWPTSRSSAAGAGCSAARSSRRSSRAATASSSPTAWPTGPRRRA